MSCSTSSIILALLLLHFLPPLISSSPSSSLEKTFTQCLTLNSKTTPIPFSTTFFTQSNPNFTIVLNSTAMSLRYTRPSVPKPVFIFTPLHVSHIQAAVICSKELGVHLRLRSGGHDYEGVSFASSVNDFPFMVLDFQRFKSVIVDIEDETAWVEAGATLGDLYYRIAEKSNVYGFPAGVCPSIGISGHISGGGYGGMLRKYGLAADNVIDALLVNSDGEILDREAMGEDLFWAIRGGGGGTFGVVVAWKLKLVQVPSKVTYFSIVRPMQEEEVKLFDTWQNVEDTIDEDLFLKVFMQSTNPDDEGQRNITIQFQGFFLGDVTRLLGVMSESFPELGLESTDCQEMRWIDSTIVMGGFEYGTSPEILLEAKIYLGYFKAKSDFATDPIPESAIQTLVARLANETGQYQFTPYGGMMSRISESATPFPNRNGTKYMIQYSSSWDDTQESGAPHFEWVRTTYDFMGPYVSMDPRRSYDNYKDFDLGINGWGRESCAEEARPWGYSYFKGNFDRLVEIKTRVDPDNFFWHEQSVPPSSLCGLKYELGSVKIE